MTVPCARHASQPAWWQCPRCFKSFCPQCISRRSGGQINQQTFYFCPACNVEARNLDLSQVITPFWERLHKFFVYPVSSWSSAGLILVFSILSIFFGQPGFFSSICRFLLWALMVKYAFEALRATASGNFQPPPLSGKVMGDNFGIVFKQIGLYFALFLIFLFFVVKAGPQAMALCLIAGAILLPAMLMILIINDNLAQALNPVLIIGVICRIGWSYVLLLFFLLLLSGAPAAIGYVVIRHLPHWMQVFIIMAANNYYTLITYHMMGYVILQFHNRLDYPVELETILASLYPAGLPSDQKNDNSSKDPQNVELLNDISRLVQQGELDNAVQLIEMRVKTSQIEDLDLSERYLGLLRMRKRHQQFLEYAAHHMQLLAKSGSKSKAIALYLECIRLNKSFVPQALVLFKIAGWLDEAGKNREAIYALNCLIKSFPQDAMVPKALYRAAQIFHERLKDAERSKKILTGLINKFPDHEITAFAKNYLGGL